MNRDIFKGEWNKIKGHVKEQWGKLTDDDITQINGKRDQLLGTLQKKYGYAKDKAEEDIKRFEHKFASGVDDKVERYNAEDEQNMEEEDVRFKKKTGTEDF